MGQGSGWDMERVMLHTAGVTVVGFYLGLPAPIDPFTLQTAFRVYIVNVAAGGEGIVGSALYHLCVLHTGILAG